MDIDTIARASVAIRQLRMSHQLTQQTVANAIGITVRQYQRWEAGTSGPRLDAAIALAKFYRVPLDVFKGDDACPNLPRSGPLEQGTSAAM